VKIALDAETAPAIELRPGMSVIPTIATRSAPTAQAATTPKAKAKLISGGSCHVKQPLNFDARNAGRDA
jgi:membrane fusion protein (multidrug efflux system)